MPDALVVRRTRKALRLLVALGVALGILLVLGVSEQHWALTTASAGGIGLGALLAPRKAIVDGTGIRIVRLFWSTELPWHDIEAILIGFRADHRTVHLLRRDGESHAMPTGSWTDLDRFATELVDRSGATIPVERIEPQMDDASARAMLRIGATSLALMVVAIAAVWASVTDVPPGEIAWFLLALPVGWAAQILPVVVEARRRRMAIRQRLATPDVVGIRPIIRAWRHRREHRNPQLGHVQVSGGDGSARSRRTAIR